MRLARLLFVWLAVPVGVSFGPGQYVSVSFIWTWSVGFQDLSAISLTASWHFGVWASMRFAWSICELLLVSIGCRDRW